MCKNVVALPSNVGCISTDPVILKIRYEPVIKMHSLRSAVNTNQVGRTKWGVCINAKVIKQDSSKNLSARASRQPPKNVLALQRRANAPSITSLIAANRKR